MELATLAPETRKDDAVMERAKGQSRGAIAHEEGRHVFVPMPSSSAPPDQRLLSLDALRGFTMFWLIGGRELALAVVACLCPLLYDAFETQATHPKWQGFVAWDMIMPVFLFVVGVSMPFAMVKRLEQGGPLRTTYLRIARRVAVLWILGMVAQGSLLDYDLGHLKLYSGALQAIAIGYLVTAIALLHLPLKGQLALFASLVIGYGALLMWVPFAGHPGGTLERTVNLARYVDEYVLGNFRRDHSFTWIITSLGFVATVLLGAMAGHLLRGRLSAERKLALLVGIGLACMAGGWVWSYFLPLNRHLWTSSMILWAGGISFLLLALFYAVIDVVGVKKWALPFIVIGANALLAYVFTYVFERVPSDTLIFNLAVKWAPPYDELLRSIAEISVLWLLLWYLYRNRTFLRA
jgi:predicted acyltransferase